MTAFARLLFICCLLASAAAFSAAPAGIKDPEAMLGNEIARLDDLIQATRQSLETQQKLKNEILDYQKVQLEFLANPKDNDLLLKVVKSAHKTLRTIKENRLEKMFDPDFIDELTVLAQPANKRGVPKP